MAIPNKSNRAPEPAPMAPANNSQGKRLAKLIGNHTQAQIELSWKGSRPIEEHYELHYQAGKAIRELYEFCKNELGISLQGGE